MMGLRPSRNRRCDYGQEEIQYLDLVVLNEDVVDLDE